MNVTHCKTDDILPFMPFFDPNPFIEEDQFDFMLFIHNVLSDPTRGKDIWTDNAEWTTEAENE